MQSLTIKNSSAPIKFDESDLKAVNIESGISSELAFIRISGKEFIMLDGGIKIPIGKEVNGIIVGSGAISRIYYATKYNPNQEIIMPDCASYNGITPDNCITKPCAKSCAECEKSAWGSRITDDGKKAKACREYKRIILFIKNESSHKLFRLDVPTTSMPNLAKYGKSLQLLDNPTPVQAVLTKITFDPTCDYAKLIFDAIAYLNAEQWAEVKNVMNDPAIENMLTLTGSLDTSTATPTEKTTQKQPKAKPMEVSKGGVNKEAFKVEEEEKVDIIDVADEKELQNILQDIDIDM